MELSAGRAAFSYLFCANGWNFATLNTHTQPHTDTQRWQQQSKQLAKVTRPRGACSRLRFLPHKQVYLFLPRRPIEAQPFAELSGQSANLRRARTWTSASDLTRLRSTRFSILLRSFAAAKIVGCSS